MDKIKKFIEELKTKHIDFAVIKLSIFYVLIIMTISVSFSLILHRISYQEIDRGLGRQFNTFWDQNDIGMMNTRLNFESIRQDQIDQANQRLMINLVYFNLLILIFSAVASYFFAKKTLEPIKKSMDDQNRFTADASHELRTPLTAMKTEIEVSLRDKKLNLAEAKNLLKSNLEEVAKLESLSNALLQLAKNENIKQNFEKINILEIITEARQKVESLATKKQIKIILEQNNLVIKPIHQTQDKQSSRIISGDASSLTELIVIILDNAIKYSPEKSRVLISLNRQGQHLIIKIKDYGVGIKESDIPYIFNRFYRADNSRNKNKIDGYGLGLSIAKQIVDLHDGTISVNSNPGEGSEFTIKF